MRFQLLCWWVAVLLVGMAPPRSACAGGRSAYAADRDEDDIDEDEEAATKRRKRKEKEDEDRRRRDAERRRAHDDDDLRDDDDRGTERRRRRDDEGNDRDRRRSRDDDDLRDEGDGRRRRRDDGEDLDRRRAREEDRDDDLYDDEMPRHRRHRAGDRGPAFRWGLGVGPAIAVSNGGGTTTAVGGLNLVVARLGYQFPQMGSIALGIFAEPRLGAFFSRPFDTTIVAIQLAGTFGLQLNIGKYFFFATGLSVGGNLTTGFGDVVRGPVSGGFLLRAGVDLLLHKRFGRPSALSLAIEALPMFAQVSTLSIDGTATFATIGFSVGFESY